MGEIKGHRAGGRRTRGIAALALTLAAVGATACGSSPVSPDQRIPPTTGPPDALLIIDWNFGAAATTARAEATWGHLYSTSRDVTHEAVWESGAPQITTVVTPGRLLSVSEGDAELRVTFRGVTVVHHLRVFSGEPPWPILEAGSTTYVSGAVRNAAGTSPGNGIEGATVEIVEGHNRGRSTTTDRAGYYYFYPPFLCGPITVRATKAGFRDAVASSIMCMTGMPQLAMIPE